MIGDAYFADAPVVINISDLAWPSGSSVHVVKLGVKTHFAEPEPFDPEAELERMHAEASAYMTGRFGNDIVNNCELLTRPNYSITDASQLFNITITLAGGAHLLAWFCKYAADGTMVNPNIIYQWIVAGSGIGVMTSTYDRAVRILKRGPIAPLATPYMFLQDGNAGLSSLYTAQRQYYTTHIEPPATEPISYDGAMSFQAEIGDNDNIDFDISSALRAMFAGYDFATEVEQANAALANINTEPLRMTRNGLDYRLLCHTEYIREDGVPVVSPDYVSSVNSWAVMGRWTEYERYAKMSHEGLSWMFGTVEGIGAAGMLATTKPAEYEMIGPDSIVVVGVITYYTAEQDSSDSDSSDSAEDDNPITTLQLFYPQRACPDKVFMLHGQIYMRTDAATVDFLFVNSRGALESVSAITKEAETIEVTTTQYALVGRPTFKPNPSITAKATGGRRSWSMSSGHVSREWAAWWTLEFLMAKQWWMRYDGAYVPVTVQPKSKDTNIYDLTKQEMASVEFTVTLALEG